MDTLVQSLLLRRTKETKNRTTGAEIVKLPPRTVEEHDIALTESERRVYDEVFSFSQQAMLNYMAKQDEKNDDEEYMKHVNQHGSGRDYKFKSSTADVSGDRAGGRPAGGGTSAKINASAFRAGKDVKTHHLLVLLLRLRQVIKLE